jgi:lysophospholipase L1-like esterase
VTQPSYDLEFIHRFNLYQGAGLSIAEDSIEAIARVYGVSPGRLQAIEDRFRTRTAALAGELRESLPPFRTERNYRIMAIGDSMTADREGYVDILRSYWGADPGRALYNVGRSGETTADVLGRLEADILPRTFDWAVLFIGSNDCGGPAGSGGQVSITESARNLDYLVDHLLDAGKKVIQVTLPTPDNDRTRAFFGDGNWHYEPERIAAMNRLIRGQSHVKGTGLADLAEGLSSRNIDPLQRDGLHLSARGHLLLAESIARLLP